MPGATGGDGSLTYTIDPALPHGLLLNGTTITGAATEARAETSDTLAASDADGDAATLTFRLAVASATAPKISDAAVTSTLSRGGDTYAMGDAITVRIDFDRLVAVGGSPRLGIGTATRYAMLSTRAPPGPGLRSASSATGTGGAPASGGGALAGTPTGEQAAATYTLEGDGCRRRRDGRRRGDAHLHHRDRQAGAGALGGDQPDVGRKGCAAASTR